MDVRLDPELGTGRAERLLHAGESFTTAGRFADAEPDLLESHQRIAVLPNIPPETERRGIRAFVELHDSWTAAEPTAERTAEAAEWKARIEAK